MTRKTKKRLGLWLGFMLILFYPFYARGYEEVTVTDSGTIRGFVRVQGKLPKLPAPEVFKFSEVCKNVPDEGLVIGPDRGVRYAVMVLQGITKGKAVEREAVNELDNVNCRFVPHVQAASVGQWLVIKNRDPILPAAHAIFEDGQPQFNIGLFPGRVKRKPLVNPGIVKGYVSTQINRQVTIDKTGVSVSGVVWQTGGIAVAQSQQARGFILGSLDQLLNKFAAEWNRHNP